MCSSDLSENKPSPVPYLTALERTGLVANEAFAVEDSLVGATSASRAGMGVFLIPDSSFERNYSEKDKENLQIIEQGKDLKIVIDFVNKKTAKNS